LKRFDRLTRRGLPARQIGRLKQVLCRWRNQVVTESGILLAGSGHEVLSHKSGLYPSLSYPAETLSPIAAQQQDGLHPGLFAKGIRNRSPNHSSLCSG